MDMPSLPENLNARNTVTGLGIAVLLSSFAALLQRDSVHYYLPGTFFIALGLLSIAMGWPNGTGKTAAAEFGTTVFRLRLMWQHQFQFIGIYRAQKQLHERDGKGEAVQLQVNEGGSPVGLDPRATVSRGIDELGITSATALVRWFHDHRDAAENEQLVPLLVIFQRSPACLIYRSQTAFPEKELRIKHLTGARFLVADIGDPAAMEFRALCTQHQVQNLQWDFSAFSKETIDDPCVNLQAGGTADYRLGYSYNEGFRALQNHSVDRQRYVYALLADVFEQPCLYADVLFTRQELWKSAKVPIGKIVNKILESYKYFLDTTEPDRLRHEEINRLMTENCREWWLDLTQGKHFDRPASKLIEQLAESWGRKREQHKRGDPDAWRELEKRVLLDTGADPDIAPYYEWIRGLGES